MTPPIIHSTNLTYNRADWQLNIADFTLKSGEFLGIIGANGAGKSTFLRLLAGVLKPASGTINLLDKSITAYERSAVARIIGYLPQENFCQYNATVYETVELGRFPHKGGFAALSPRDREVIEESLELTGLVAYSRRRLSELSGGERKRVFLASVLALEPQALLLDEPVAALDLHHQSEFFRLLRRLSRKGMAIAVVTHELNLASLFCSEIMLLSNGKLMKRGSSPEILDAEMIEKVYGKGLSVFTHPTCQAPIVLPLEDLQESEVSR